jgi:hypothetical protein|mmetsp:Transcript_77429/g.129938  ORF Transcript_77429/g.129938 Transcript_77429/m.129938 type:complete len:96 (+) Transcript_77429:1354-1641(+)
MQERLVLQKSSALLNIANGILLLQIMPAKQPCEAQKSKMTAVLVHIFSYIFSVCPLHSLLDAARICSTWAVLARFAIKETEMESEQYVKDVMGKP